MIQDEIMKLQTYKMFEGDSDIYVERDDVLEVLKQEPCEDCISRAKTCGYIAGFINHEYSTQSECEMVDAMIEGIQHLPSVKQEPKTGHWIRQTDDYHDYYECEYCGIAVGLDDIKNYCPNCGSYNGGVRWKW